MSFSNVSTPNQKHKVTGNNTVCELLERFRQQLTTGLLRPLQHVGDHCYRVNVFESKNLTLFGRRSQISRQLYKVLNLDWFWNMYVVQNIMFDEISTLVLVQETAAR